VKKFLICALALLLVAGCDNPDTATVGSVDTAFQLIGPNHKIVTKAFNDPKIDGITVFVAKAETGGIKGGLGLAEDTSDASIAVRQTGPLRVKENLKDSEEIFSEKSSLLFKHMHVVRFWDAEHKTFVYLVYSDRVLSGSPKNSISAVTAMPWGTIEPDLGPLVTAP